MREVLEETGVTTKFEALVCFRHWHGYRYDKSDIYFVSRLSPLSKDITIQEEELAEALWMPVDTFLADEGVSLFNKTIVRAAMESPGMISSFIPGYGDGDKSKYEFFLPQEVI
jgi:8-oxo-dGTP diphosphatase